MAWMPLLMLPSALWYRRSASFAAAYLAVWLFPFFFALVFWGIWHARRVFSRLDSATAAAPAL